MQQDPNQQVTGVFAIEGNAIDYVSPRQRHGKAIDLFTLWFCTNVAPLAVITGAMSVMVFELDVISALLAITAGHLFGAVVLALTSAQGPLAGIPQMIQSRAQFGRHGSLLVVLFTTIIYLGYFVSNIILSGKTLHAVVPAIPVSVATVIGAGLATLIGVVGYHLIHVFNRIGAWFMGGALLIGLALMIPHLTPDVLQQGRFSAAPWFSMFGICAVWQISFAPYTSDYSRYLPLAEGRVKPFVYTYLGASLGTIFSFVFGMVAVSIGHQGDAMEAVKAHTGMFGAVLMVLFLCNIIGHNAMNLYGAVLSFITAIQTFVADWVPKGRARIAMSMIVLVLSTGSALWASSDFVSLFISGVFAILFVMAPWVSINLFDFYVLHRNGYDIKSIFAADGGVYGRFNSRAITAYVIGIVVQLPFLKNPWFHGIWADAFAGVDVSWVLGIASSATVCALFHGIRPLPRYTPTSLPPA
ncbi:cytosine permease [Luteimonas sp. TWI1416]|uniref:purine-cytosine permease family protein n=1 Tax=unclassified Luteimonas TaxID=2629088 RepID=UPI00320A8B50